MSRQLRVNVRVGGWGGCDVRVCGSGKKRFTRGRSGMKEFYCYSGICKYLLIRVDSINGKWSLNKEFKLQSCNETFHSRAPSLSGSVGRSLAHSQGERESERESVCVCVCVCA